MPIEFACTHCGKQLRTPDETAGRQAKCPQCGGVVPIPQAAAFAPAAEAGGDEFNFNPYQSPTISAAHPHRGGDYGDVELASLGARLGGALLDGLIGFASILPGAIYFGVSMAMANDNGPGERGGDEVIFAAVGPIVLMGIGALAITIVNWVMISQSGQSIGKKIVGTRIVRLDGSLPGFGYGVAMRNWLPGFIANIPYVGFLFAIANILFIFGQERRCIHDHMAGTRVVVA